MVVVVTNALVRSNRRDEVRLTTPVPRPLTVLGTDGFGRSDDRAHLRRFFETDAAHVVVGVLSAMSRSGTIEASLAMKAIDRFGIDADVDPPWTL